jgi:hypothetical protein
LARQTLLEHTAGLSEGLFVVLAEPPGAAMAALTDLVAWKWVMENTPQLAGDRYAREEVTRQIGHAERSLRARLGGLGDLAIPSGRRVELFHRGAANGTRIAAGRELLTLLGKECGRIFSTAPQVLNELINRRWPSGAAVAARTKLVEAMATAPGRPNLGMDDTKRPPEMALYLSILRNGGFHVEAGSGWVFQVPSSELDRCNLRPSLDLITRTLRRAGTDMLIPVPEVFRALSIPPFGVREGLQPLILAIYLATHHQRVALYEDGTYLHEVGGDVFLRLMKEPQFFHLQYCGLEGIRADVFAKLMHMLEVDPRDVNKADLIDLVRPLAVFISREVPEYSRKSVRLSAAAVAVRQALLLAREPVRLVFRTLPEACGLPPIAEDGLNEPDELAARLRSAMHEIRTAYPRLITRLESALCAAFDASGGMPGARGIIADRAAQLAVAVTEPELRALCLRLADTALDDRAWVESVANLLTRKSPERWLDTDEVEFYHQLGNAAGRFKRMELTFFGANKKLNGHAYRITLTRSDGTEVGDLVDWDGMDENRVRPVESEIQEILARHGRHGLAAALRAIWTRLSLGEESKST